MTRTKDPRIGAALASLCALSMAGVNQELEARTPPGLERCAGIVKAGMNDCATATHSCAGMAKEDGMEDEWIFLPEGTCERIVGGKIYIGEESES